jgi:hypothetical protein
MSNLHSHDIFPSTIPDGLGTSSYPRFWSDDFDMDLLKLWPDLPEKLGPTSGVHLWTVGSMTYGRLNHPTVWNAHTGCLAYLWFEKQNLPRDPDGWFRIHGCVSNSPEIECTWLEWLRSWWPHHHGFLLSSQYFDACCDEHFTQIMNHVRGLDRRTDAGFAYAKSLGEILAVNNRFARLAEAHRLGREDYPYFTLSRLLTSDRKCVAPFFRVRPSLWRHHG